MERVYKSENTISADNIQMHMPLLRNGTSDSTRYEDYSDKGHLSVYQCLRITIKNFFPVYISLLFDVGAYVVVYYFMAQYTGENYYVGGMGIA